jgi:hypothetical protein
MNTHPNPDDGQNNNLDIEEVERKFTLANERIESIEQALLNQDMNLTSDSLFEEAFI